MQRKMGGHGGGGKGGKEAEADQSNKILSPDRVRDDGILADNFLPGVKKGDRRCIIVRVALHTYIV